MPKGCIEFLQGTLDMLILRALSVGALHGHAMAATIERTSSDVLQVDHGSLYPGLHGLSSRHRLMLSGRPRQNRIAAYQPNPLTLTGARN